MSFYLLDESEEDSTTANPIAPVGCGIEIKTPGTEFISTNFPENYPNNEDCVHKIKFDEGKRIQLVFLDFDLEEHANCV